VTFAHAAEFDVYDMKQMSGKSGNVRKKEQNLDLGIYISVHRQILCQHGAFEYPWSPYLVPSLPV
jgi:hypothetical protein